MTIEGARGRSLLDLAKDFPEDPAVCLACGAMAGCCSQYPNCPGNPDWRPTVDKNIAAFTPPGATYPPYVSINEREGQVEITVRSPITPEGNCGPTAAMSMSRDEFDKLIAEASIWLAERGR